MKKFSILIPVLFVAWIAGIFIFLFCFLEPEVFWPKMEQTNRYKLVGAAETIVDAAKGQFLLVNPRQKGNRVYPRDGDGAYFHKTDLVTDPRESACWKIALQQVTSEMSLLEAVGKAAASENSPKISRQIIEKIRVFYEGNSRATLESFTDQPIERYQLF